MSITAGSQINASDFVDSSAGAADAGKGVKLDSNGKISKTMLPGGFGGTGADGALSISSGTTTLDAAGAAVLVKNYTSISITGTAVLTISNPHANGTILVLKSQGNVTITSSATRAIDLRAMGGTAGSENGSGSPGHGLIAGPAGGYGNGPNTANNYSNLPTRAGGVHNAGVMSGKGINVYAGGGGGGGSTGGTTPGAGGAGGRGGGGLYIECGGALNISSTIDLSGANGSNGSGGSGSSRAAGGGSGGGSYLDGERGSFAPSGTDGGGGGGGGSGSGCIVYNTLTSNTGTYTVTGGTAGTGGPSGGNGGTGRFDVIAYTDLI